MRVLVVVPAWNEAANLPAVIAELRSARADDDRLVVDDGSSDGTAEVARAHGTDHVVRLTGHRGLAVAFQAGIDAALKLGADVVVNTDADHQYRGSDIPRLVAPILAGEADYVVGSRFAHGHPHTMRPHRELGNRVLTAWVRRLTGRRITDGQSGYRALSPAAATAAVIRHDFNYAQVLTLDLLDKGFRYHEVPISYRFRTTGSSFIRLGPYLRAVVPAVRAHRLEQAQPAQSSTTWERNPSTAAAHA